MKCNSRFPVTFFRPVLYQLNYPSGSVRVGKPRDCNGRELAMICDLRPYHKFKTRTAHAVPWLCVLVLFAGVWPAPVRAGETPDSPNVKKVVSAALKFLESHTDEHLGGKCLIGLAFLKAGKLDHPKVREAVAECAKMVRTNPDEGTLDNYSNGLAIIFLCEVSAQKYSRDIQFFLDRLKARQKKNGGWGYKD